MPKKIANGTMDHCHFKCITKNFKYISIYSQQLCHAFSIKFSFVPQNHSFIPFSPFNNPQLITLMPSADNTVIKKQHPDPYFPTFKSNIGPAFCFPYLDPVPFVLCNTLPLLSSHIIIFLFAAVSI